MRQDLKTIFADDPEMLTIFERQEQSALLKRVLGEKESQDFEAERERVSLLRQLVTMKAEVLRNLLVDTISPLIPDPVKGDAGADGYTPVKGKDYKDGEDGRTPTRSELLALIKPLVPVVENGKDGKNADEVDIDAIIERLIEKIKKDKPIDISNIRNAQSFMFGSRKYKTEELLHGGGPTLVAGSGVTITSNSNGTTTISATGATISSETPVGAVDGVNTTYTVTHTPLFVIADSNFRIAGQGYTYAAPTITMDPLIPPVEFIQSYYAA